ncbi:SAM-dependent methyltransferase [Microbacterium sp.]|uniref:SAM-dependent methyltransferase n=1 Tax=Microbacterium sp. TaxID=51671 RepID=UPI002735A4C3|nr:SAM-dependent methyltransferase [Microbacterium sp.]MDP3949857.1 SAM-dependent methyltransferase [Microbacterium sp.]
MDPSLFYRPGALLSQQELGAARLDGLLVEVGEGYMPADLPEDAGARAAAVSPILSPGYAASGPTAAWVHGVGDTPPARHHTQRAVDHRPRIDQRRDVIAHEGRVPHSDLIVIGEIPVTTPLRTLTDLVLTSGRYRECAVWMPEMAAAFPSLVPQVQTLLAARSRMPGKRAAMSAVAALLALPAREGAQDDVTLRTT